LLYAILDTALIPDPLSIGPNARWWIREMKEKLLLVSRRLVKVSSLKPQASSLKRLRHIVARQYIP